MTELKIGMEKNNRILKSLHRFFATLCLLAGSHSLFAQQPVGVRFSAYNQAGIQEKIFAHTDKQTYLAGEILWFKLYAVDGVLNQPLDLSKVAYVEMLDRNNVSVLKGKIGMRKGSGSGSFFLPLALPSGNYRLRAYTNWMKNFGPSLYFEKKITVINTLKAPTTVALKTGVNYDIQFFPEGGNLVSGVQSRVGFRVVGRDGKGKSCTGVILDQLGQQVAHFQSLKFGLGQFYFTPQANVQYHAEIKVDNDSTIKAPLPAIRDHGYTLTLKDTLQDQVSVQVTADEGTADEAITLFVNTRQAQKMVVTEHSTGHRAVFMVSRAALGEGISHFTIFDGADRPLCERLYFKLPEKLNLQVSADKSEYNQREKITVNLSSQLQGIAVPADLSVSVFLADSLQEEEGGDLLSYLWLSSDLSGQIESPSYYFNAGGPEWKEAVDNLMLTQGWRRFKWDDVLQANPVHRSFVPEYEGHLVNGRLTDKRTGQPAEDIPAFLSVRGTHFQFKSTTSDKQGHLLFNLPDFYGGDEIIVQTNTVKDTSYRIEIFSPFSDQYSKDSLPVFSVPDHLQSLLLSHSISAQVQNAFFPDSARRFFSPVSDTTLFYGIPSRRYNLDDYTRFTSLEEIFREYIEEVAVRRPEGKSRILVLRADRNYFTEEPLILLDGVPYFNADTVLHFDPLKIKRLEVMDRMYYMGYRVEPGVVSMTTYNGDLSASTLDPNAIILEYEGMQLEREFFSPVYETGKQVKSRIPDMRTTLYWSPDAGTDEAGKKLISFFSSDQPGNYWIVVEGLGASGTAGSRIVPIHVK